MKATVWIGHDNSVRIEDGKKPTFKQMQEWVGGYVERTVVTWEGQQCSMYVNEDGHSMGLPYNARATSLLAIATSRPGTLGALLLQGQAHAVVGNVVLVIGWRNW